MTTLSEDTRFQASTKNKTNVNELSKEENKEYEDRDNKELESDDEFSDQSFYKVLVITLKVLQILRLRLMPTQLSRLTIHVLMSLIALVHLQTTDATLIPYI